VKDLGEYHWSDEPPGKTQRMMSWVVIAVILAAGAGYAVHTGMFNSHRTHATQSHPRGR
jgi:hypothetical protein